MFRAVDCSPRRESLELAQQSGACSTALPCLWRRSIRRLRLFHSCHVFAADVKFVPAGEGRLLLALGIVVSENDNYQSLLAALSGALFFRPTMARNLAGYLA